LRNTLKEWSEEVYLCTVGGGDYFYRCLPCFQIAPLFGQLFLDFLQVSMNFTACFTVTVFFLA